MWGGSYWGRRYWGRSFWGTGGSGGTGTVFVPGNPSSWPQPALQTHWLLKEKQMHCPLEKYALANDLYDMVCAKLLRPGELVVGTPVVEYQPEGLTGADALTIGTPVVNTEVVEYPDGSSAQPGEAIQVRIQGGSSDGADPREYLIIASFTTSLGNTKIATGILQVVPLRLQ